MIELKHEYTANTKTPEAEAKLVMGITILVDVAASSSKTSDMTEGALAVLSGMFHGNLIKADGEYIMCKGNPFRRILDLELGEE